MDAGTPLTKTRLVEENRLYAQHRGTSNAGRAQGFLPAFCDLDTNQVYVSCYADGSLAPVHVLEGLPPELIIAPATEQSELTIKPSVVAGFLRGQRFYRRDEAAAIIAAETKLEETA